MNVIVVIEGKEAIPVRAIPMLTNWEQMSPDELADALAGDDHSHQFRSLSAYRFEHGKVVSIPALWWENGPCRKLKALSDRIRATEITHETGYQDWQRQSLLSLPAGAFVWKEEYVPLHERKFNLESITFLSSNTSSGVMAPDEQQRRTVLDFNPFIDDPETARAVMAGFGPVVSGSEIHAVTDYQALPEPAPVVEAPARESKAQATGPNFTMKKAALIEQHKQEWPTIEGDIKDAHRNGLDAAKAGAREWDESRAMEWARAKGKLSNTDKPTQTLAGAMNSMANLTGRKHTLQG